MFGRFVVLKDGKAYRIWSDNDDGTLNVIGTEYLDSYGNYDPEYMTSIEINKSDVLINNLVIKTL